MQVEGVRRLVRRLEDRQRFLSKVRADGVAVIEREQEAQVREVRLEQREPPKVVRAVARDDAQPGVQQVVGLLEEAAVVDGHRLHRLGGLLLQRARIRAVQHERQRAPPEEVAVDLELRQRVAELADRRARGVVDQHLLGPRLRRHVVHDRHALVEEVPAAALDIPPHPVAGDALPLEAGDELAGDLVQVLQQERERLARRLLHREHLDDAVADQEVVAVAVDGGIRDEVVQVRVVREPGGIDHGWRVVHQLAEEAEGVLPSRDAPVRTRRAAPRTPAPCGAASRWPGPAPTSSELQSVRRARAMPAAPARGACQRRRNSVLRRATCGAS